MGVVAGGGYGPNTYTNVIEYITIASTGNGTDFGDLTALILSFRACGLLGLSLGWFYWQSC